MTTLDSGEVEDFPLLVAYTYDDVQHASTWKWFLPAIPINHNMLYNYELTLFTDWKSGYVYSVIYMN